MSIYSWHVFFLSSFFFSSIRFSSLSFCSLETFSAATRAANIWCGFQALESVSLQIMFLSLCVRLFVCTSLLLQWKDPFCIITSCLEEEKQTHPPGPETAVLLKELCSPCPLPLVLPLNSIYMTSAVVVLFTVLWMAPDTILWFWQ